MPVRKVTSGARRSSGLHLQGTKRASRRSRTRQLRRIAVNQMEKAKRFAKLHVKGKPLLLYNAWDAGSAKAILAAGARAIATSSWPVPEAQGHREGEAIP